MTTEVVEQLDYKKLYHQALTDSSAIDYDSLDALIAMYPYSQPLRHVLARKRRQEGLFDTGALLFSNLPLWLYGYIVQETSHSETPSAASGYFVYETNTEQQLETIETADEPPAELNILSESNTYERITLYDDEQLPYSFRWWLKKTRMAYSDTYQPYAPAGTSTFTDQTVDLDEVQVLDQQIRENIFHLQAPEEKMSTTHVVPQTVPFQPSKKIDPIIERFIREEPQIKPPTIDKIDLENKARKSAEDQLTLVTETLAKIYTEQGLYPKAIAIYKKLSLKYPEKSTYFAAQIIELENKLR